MILHKRWKIFKTYISWEDYLGGALLLSGVLGYFILPIPMFPRLTMAYGELRSELIGIGVIVLIINNANEAIKRREDKKRLILQMGSPDRTSAIEAARQLKERGWLTDGTLREVHLTEANLSKAHLEGANLEGAHLEEAHLEGARLHNAYLTGAHLWEAHLEGAYLLEASLSRAYLREANLEGARLHNAHLWEAHLGRAHLEGADLRGADLTGAYLEGAHLEGADLAWAHLEEAHMRNADLKKAHLWKADLRGADLTGANLEGAEWTDLAGVFHERGAYYDEFTRWPAGFDPVKEGAVKMEL